MNDCRGDEPGGGVGKGGGVFVRVTQSSGQRGVEVWSWSVV